MTEVNKYRIWCNNVSSYVYVWSESEPTNCPEDMNHVIDTSKTTIDAVISDNTVSIKEENIPTGGAYKAYGVNFVANGSTTTTHDFSIPYPISLLSAIFPTVGKTSGDVVDLIVSPDVIVGAITANVASDDTVVNVQSTVVANMKVGRYAVLTDGTNSDERVVTEVGDTTITVTPAIGNAYSAVTPTYVKMNIKMGENLAIEKDARYEWGDSKIGGSYLPANTTIRISYYNNSASQVTVRPIFEFLY